MTTLTEARMADARREIPLMGGVVEIVLYGVDETLAASVFPDVEREALRLQKVFNFYDPKSELSKLNREREIVASQELRDVITAALRHCAIAEGRYDISLGKQFLERKRGETITPLACSYKDILIDGNRVALGHPDAMVDLGSIAKGYVADCLLAFINRLGVENAFIDARGDLRITGDRLEAVGVQDPRDSSRVRHTIILKNLAVATSGDYRQYHGTYEQSHIINAADIISATVVAPTLMEADVVASVLFVSGGGMAHALARKFPDAKAFLITKDGQEIMLNGFERLLLTQQAEPAQRHTVEARDAY